MDSLGPETFKGLLSLEYLTIYAPYVVEIKERNFSYFTKLTVINFNGVAASSFKLKVIHKGAFNNLSLLQEINLSFNSISKIEKSATT